MLFMKFVLALDIWKPTVYGVSGLKGSEWSEMAKYCKGHPQVWMGRAWTNPSLSIPSAATTLSSTWTRTFNSGVSSVWFSIGYYIFGGASHWLFLAWYISVRWYQTHVWCVGELKDSSPRLLRCDTKPDLWKSNWNLFSRCWRRSQQVPHLDFGCAGGLNSDLEDNIALLSYNCVFRAVESYLRGGTSHADQVNFDIKGLPHNPKSLHHNLIVWKLYNMANSENNYEFRCSYCDVDSCNT